mmetsp:Transcript_19549/g.14255  ORF Transcript_19549/g.14255 Transcript_19549/m.14255 type:complete len:104 (-) Transcript_19549:1573-1884(-)
MYEIEVLDRGLFSLHKLEEAYTDLNNRIIENVNLRKDRLNELNNRLASMSEKIVALYNSDQFVQANEAMKIVSPAHFPVIKTLNDPKLNPHQCIFFEPRDYAL